MEPVSSLPCSKNSATGLHPEPDDYSWYRPISFLKIYFQSKIYLPNGLLYLGFTFNKLYEFMTSLMSATPPTYLILHFFITPALLGEKYKLWSSSYVMFSLSKRSRHFPENFAFRDPQCFNSPTSLSHNHHHLLQGLSPIWPLRLHQIYYHHLFLGHPSVLAVPRCSQHVDSPVHSCCREFCVILWYHFVFG